MRKIFIAFIISVLIVLNLPLCCSAKTYDDFSKLVEEAKKLNNTSLTFKGEAIGEPLKRGEYTWVNICDGKGTSIGIYMKKDSANIIKKYGNSKVKGDIIEVTGVFNRACKAHGGDLDVHAENVIVAENGHNIKEKIDHNKKNFSIILTAITIIITVFIIKRK